MRKGSVLVLLFLSQTLVVFGQNEGTLFFMNALPQVVYVNPAFVPKYKVSVGLPCSSIFISYNNNGFTYNDAVVRTGADINADLTQLQNALRPKNYITLAAQAEAFRLSMKVSPRLYLTYNSTAKVYGRLLLPKDLIGLFVDGNSSFVGATASLAPKGESLAFLENALGGAFTVNKDLVIGARVKWLKGIVNATTKEATMDITFDDVNYAVTMTGSLDARTSGIQYLTSGDFDFDTDRKKYLKNNGLGIDLGATYRLMDRINLAFSIVDLGYIKWTNDTYGYQLDKASYTFSGVDLNEVLNGNEDYLSTLGDSIQTNFEPTEKTIAAYKTGIPTKMYLGGTFELRRNFTAGLVLYSEMFQGRTALGTTLGLTKNFGKRFSTSGTYTISNSSYNNIGLGASLNLPPFQLYMVGDNILRAAMGGKELNKFINSTQVFNLRVGLNLVFGWDKGPDKVGGYQPSPGFKSKRKKLGLN